MLRALTHPRWIAALLLAAGAVTGGADDLRPPRVIPTERLRQAMDESRGYELTATANGPRLQADVVLRLVHEAQATDPQHQPLLIGHREWFDAFLARTGLPAEKAPLYVRKPYEVGQDLVIDYRREAVIDAVVQGPVPRTAANVRISWAEGRGTPDQYSYDDLLSRPTLRVVQKRVITYRLVEYGDRLWYAEIEGLRGRPTSGALGVLFDVIGEAGVEDSRSAFGADGVEVTLTRGSKWGLSKTVTATVWPDGHADEDVPKSRPDLAALGARLREPLEIRFRTIR